MEVGCYKHGINKFFDPSAIISKNCKYLWCIIIILVEYATVPKVQVFLMELKSQGLGKRYEWEK